MNNNERVGAVWVNMTKKGEKYIKGVVRVGGFDVRFVGFKNNFKKDEHDTDFVLYKSEEQKQTNEQAGAVQEKRFEDNLGDGII